MKRRLIFAIFSVFLMLAPAVAGAAQIEFSNDGATYGAGIFNYDSSTSAYSFGFDIFQIAIDPSASSGLASVTMDLDFFPAPDGQVSGGSTINAQFDAGLSTFNSVDGSFGFDDFTNGLSVLTGFGTTTFDSLTIDPLLGSLLGSGFLNFDPGLPDDLTSNYFPGTSLYAFTLVAAFDSFDPAQVDDIFEGFVTSFTFTAVPGQAGTPVPEPGTFALLGSGLVGLMGFRGRRLQTR